MWTSQAPSEDSLIKSRALGSLLAPTERSHHQGWRTPRQIQISIKNLRKHVVTIGETIYPKKNIGADERKKFTCRWLAGNAIHQILAGMSAEVVERVCDFVGSRASWACSSASARSGA